MKKFAAVALIAMAAVGSLAACGASSGSSNVPSTKTNAINVQEVRGVGSDLPVFIFEVVHDGETLICSTKESMNAGVSCIKK